MIRVPCGDELVRQLEQMGVDIQTEVPPFTQTGMRQRADDDELQRRFMEAMRHRREYRLWVVALLAALAALASAAASVVSALAAWHK